MLSDLPQRGVKPGELNPLNQQPNGIELPDQFQQTATDADAISYVLNKVVEKDARLSIEYPAKAIVLDSYLQACRNPIEGSTYATSQEPARLRLYVRARIPEIHASIPEPNKIAHPDPRTAEDERRINMHHIFIADLDDISRRNVPAPGDIVMVDYDDRQKLQGGKYKGIAERGPGTIADRGSPTFSGKQYFERSKRIRNKPAKQKTRRERSLNADFYQYPLTLADYQTG